MEFKQEKEYQTVRIFAILGALTLMLVLLFKVVLFAPQASDLNRQPAEINKELIKYRAKEQTK